MSIYFLCPASLSGRGEAGDNNSDKPRLIQIHRGSYFVGVDGVMLCRALRSRAGVSRIQEGSFTSQSPPSLPRNNVKRILRFCTRSLTNRPFIPSRYSSTCRTIQTRSETRNPVSFPTLRDADPRQRFTIRTRISESILVSKMSNISGIFTASLRGLHFDCRTKDGMNDGNVFTYIYQISLSRFRRKKRKLKFSRDVSSLISDRCRETSRFLFDGISFAGEGRERPIRHTRERNIIIKH